MCGHALKLPWIDDNCCLFLCDELLCVVVLGGCGACVVMLSSYNPETKEVKERTVNSCLVLLCSIDGCAITTTEGLGNQRDGLHSIHQRLSAFHASQCGFCTPGMTMAIYGCLKKEQQKTSTSTSKHTIPPTPDGGCNNHHLASRPTSETLEKSVLGHICRCTGYRPILDTCKSFASDIDLEDLGLNSCWSGASQATQENLPVYDPNNDPKFPRFLMEELEARISQNRGDSEEGGHSSAFTSSISASEFWSVGCFCIQHIPCLVRFQCMLGGGLKQRSFYIGSVRVKLILGCQEILKVWPSGTKIELLFSQILHYLHGCTTSGRKKR